MKRYFILIKTDLKNIFRDPSLFMILIVPVIITALLYFGWPWLSNQWPIIVQYKPLILGAFCLISAAMPGMAISFVILDEKDENLIQTLHILPISFSLIIRLRMTIIFLFGVIASTMMLLVSGMISGNELKAPFLAILASAIAPMSACIPAFMAKNKIEGMTWAKMLNFIMVLPLPAFFIQGNLEYLFGIIPSYWIYKSFMLVDNNHFFIFFWSIGILYHAVLLFFTFKWIEKVSLR